MNLIKRNKDKGRKWEASRRKVSLGGAKTEVEVNNI